ncbi:MAG: hypothetical protein V4437_01065 [Patescibacteria group bacterium]
MEKVNTTVKIYAQVISFLTIWAGVILISGIFNTVDLWQTIALIPQAITIYAIVCVLFIKWIWRWELLQGWLIKVPDLQGTWRGELRSDWINPETNSGIAPIPIIVVIKQTFSSIKCTLMTQESTSYSTAAEIVKGGDGDLHLTYNYTNRPRVTLRDRSQIHDGAAILRLIKKPEQMLEGEYWTSRKTRGEITLKFSSHKLEERFT